MKIFTTSPSYFSPIKFLVLFLLLGLQTQAQVPNEKLRSYLTDTYGLTFDATNVIANPEVADTITVLKLPQSIRPLEDLSGIEQFSQLRVLLCSYNPLGSLDLTHFPKLEVLYASSCELTHIDLSNNPLLTYVNVASNMALEKLDLTHNRRLITLQAHNTGITSLDFTNNPDISVIYARNGRLKTLDVSQNTKLSFLEAYNNELTSIDLSNANQLTKLYLYENQLTSIDVSNQPQLEQLYVHRNNITSVNLSNNPLLINLGLSHNPIKEIDLSAQKALRYLSINHTELDLLDLSNNPELTNVERMEDHVSIIFPDEAWEEHYNRDYLQTRELPKESFSDKSPLTQIRIVGLLAYAVFLLLTLGILVIKRQRMKELPRKAIRTVIILNLLATIVTLGLTAVLSDIDNQTDPHGLFTLFGFLFSATYVISFVLQLIALIKALAISTTFSDHSVEGGQPEGRHIEVAYRYAIATFVLYGVSVILERLILSNDHEDSFFWLDLLAIPVNIAWLITFIFGSISYYKGREQPKTTKKVLSAFILGAIATYLFITQFIL